MPSIEELPAPLPLQIVKQLADLKSLDALRRSSPCFRTVFDTYAVEILEHLMQQTLLAQVIIEIRAYVLLLQTKASRVKSEDDFDEIYARAQEPLAAQTPITAISSALRTFTFHASVCNFVLQNQLQHLEGLPRERPGEEQKEIAPEFWLDRPGIPCTINESWPPIWQEEQRALCATLRMMIMNTTNCPTSFISSIRQAQSVRFPWAADEVEEMARSFQELKDDGTVSECSDLRSPLSWDALATPPPYESDASEDQIHWHEGRERQISNATRPAMGFMFICSSFMKRNKYNTHPLKDADWTVFRSLGLGFWSLRRLTASLKLNGYPARLTPSITGHESRNEEDFESISLNDQMFTWWKLYEAELNRLDYD